MGIIRKTERLEKQINIKVSEEVYNRYKAAREGCIARGWEFSLQPEFTEWLNAQLAAAEKELAADDKALAKQASQSDVSA